MKQTLPKYHDMGVTMQLLYRYLELLELLGPGKLQSRKTSYRKKILLGP